MIDQSYDRVVVSARSRQLVSLGSGEVDADRDLVADELDRRELDDSAPRKAPKRRIWVVGVLPTCWNCPQSRLAARRERNQGPSGAIPDDKRRGARLSGELRVAEHGFAVELFASVGGGIPTRARGARGSRVSAHHQLTRGRAASARRQNRSGTRTGHCPLPSRLPGSRALATCLRATAIRATSRWFHSGAHVRAGLAYAAPSRFDLKVRKLPRTGRERRRAFPVRNRILWFFFLALTYSVGWSYLRLIRWFLFEAWAHAQLASRSRPLVTSPRW